MKRLGFLLVAGVACGAPPPTTVEIAQLPQPTAQTAPTATQAPIETRPALAHTDFDEARDPRRASTRAKSLIVTELSGLEQLSAATVATSPDRPSLLRRLAEDYVELRKTGDTRAGAKAIENYKKLYAEYPSYPLADDVLYDLALEYESAGDMMNARKNLYELITKYPSSRHVAYAYFGFGEMFLFEGAADPSKLELAKQAYREVLKLQSPITEAAECRLVRILTLQHDDPAARSMQQKIGHTCG
jgi:tetratricopeptide (TPR) repeat protein